MFCRCCFSIQLMMEPDKCWCLHHCKNGAGWSSPTTVWWLGQARCTVELKLAFVVSFNSTACMLFRKMSSQVLSLIRGSI